MRIATSWGTRALGVAIQFVGSSVASQVSPYPRATSTAVIIGGFILIFPLRDQMLAGLSSLDSYIDNQYPPLLYQDLTPEMQSGICVLMYDAEQQGFRPTINERLVSTLIAMLKYQKNSKPKTYHKH